MMRSSVVLPDPEGPRSATSSPVSTVRLTSLRALNAPNCFEMIFCANAQRGYSCPPPSVADARLPTDAPFNQALFSDERHQRQSGCNSSDAAAKAP